MTERVKMNRANNLNKSTPEVMSNSKLLSKCNDSDAILNNDNVILKLKNDSSIKLCNSCTLLVKKAMDIKDSAAKAKPNESKQKDNEINKNENVKKQPEKKTAERSTSTAKNTVQKGKAMELSKPKVNEINNVTNADNSGGHSSNKKANESIRYLQMRDASNPAEKNKVKNRKIGKKDIPSSTALENSILENIKTELNNSDLTQIESEGSSCDTRWTANLSDISCKYSQCNISSQSTIHKTSNESQSLSSSSSSSTPDMFSSSTPRAKLPVYQLRSHRYNLRPNSRYNFRTR